MATTTDMPAPTEPKCSTSDLLKAIQDALTAAKLQQQITNQSVTTLEAHLKELQDYDNKINAAVEAYRQGLDAVFVGYADLRKAVEQGKSSYECLVKEEAKTGIVKVLEDLRRRRTRLETCEWELRGRVIDKKCELDKANVEVEKANKRLQSMLDLLSARTTELAALKALKEVIGGCSDTSSNECRYAFYRDLVKRLEVMDVSVEKYRCDLVDLVTALDTARQAATEKDAEARRAQALLESVTQLHEALVAGWKDQLCAYVTAGAVPPLPSEIAKACPEPCDDGEASGATAVKSAASGAEQTEGAEQTQTGEAGAARTDDCGATQHPTGE